MSMVGGTQKSINNTEAHATPQEPDAGAAETKSRMKRGEKLA